MLSEISLFHIIFQLSFCFITLFLLAFDACLFLMALSRRNDSSHFPVAYLTVMSICGMLCKVAFLMNNTTWLFLSAFDYLREFLYSKRSESARIHLNVPEYRHAWGKEFTLLGTLNYFIPLAVSVLMTVNRLFMILRPTDQTVFSQRRIFLYCIGILILCLTVLLIPYFSTCPVNFLASQLIFQTGCWPDRHPVTRFTNTHLIWIPTTLLLINLFLVIHLKAVRFSVYSKMLQKTSTVSTSSAQVAQSQKKREQLLMRQALAVTVYLSFYEVGTFLIRTFPETYSNLPQTAQDGYFYFRLETICAMNFFVYFVESQTMRRMILEFLGCSKKKTSAVQKGSLDHQHHSSTAPKVSTISLRT